MTHPFINPLDLQTIFVSTIAGSWIIAIFIAVIGLSILAARLRMNDKVFLIFVVLFGVLMSPQLGGLYTLIMVVTGIAIYYGIAKIFKQ